MLICRRLRGFTIVELITVMVIIGILLGIGVPSFGKMIKNLQIRAHAESILNGLQLARGAAVQRNENVQFILGATGSWTVQAESPVQLIQSKSAGENSGSQLITGTLPANSTTVTFNGLGRVPKTPGANFIEVIDIDVPVSVMPASESKDLRIRILSGGLIKMCDPNVLNTADVTFCPPYPVP